MLLRRFFVEDGEQSLSVEPQTESVFLRKLRDLCLSMFLVQRPEAFQFMLVNGRARNIVSPFANLQLVFDAARERFHPFTV